jgi:hypothetical protein
MLAAREKLRWVSGYQELPTPSRRPGWAQAVPLSQRDEQSQVRDEVASILVPIGIKTVGIESSRGSGDLRGAESREIGWRVHEFASVTGRENIPE